ncbi:MAG TPA: response regulator [Syntrophomonadaceae bacterium]|nr:response regulator [Syntrophomonadaceae bacterium]
MDNSRIIMANPKLLTMLGYDEMSEFKELSTFSLWANPDSRLEFFKQLQFSQKLSGYSAQGICKDGNIKDFEISAVYNYELEYIEATVIDVTELLQVRKQAEAANLAKNQFLANMSHEIRTPMIGVLGAVDLLEQNNVNTKQLENIKIIRECSEHLLNIINDILDVSKIEIGLVHLKLENCNLYDLFYQAISMIKPSLYAKGLNLEVELNFESYLEVNLDSNKLRQILVNIFVNAIKYTTKGTIGIKAKINNIEERNNLVISISDTGIGIPNEYISSIFNPFSQGDNSSSRGFEGTGLGLYICKSLIDLMEGNIDVISSPSQGTEFIITLPVKVLIPQVLASNYVNNANKIDDTIKFIPRSILVVEDNELNQKIVAEMLRNYGFDVSTAKNGLECLQILQHERFDAILLDMQMPIMDGYETAQLIREDKDLKDIPVIAMTAHAMNGDREKCIAYGCSSYISKPFKSEHLVEEIKQHLKTHTSKRLSTPPNNLFIAELIPEFMDLLADMMEKLNIAIKNADIDEIKNISHDIKGSSGMYGFNDISNLAAQIEKTVNNNSLNKVQLLYRNLFELYRIANEQVS